MAVAAFGMLFTSCAKDDAASDGALVSFTVNAPEVATRYGEGTTATTLYWAVYDQNGRVESLQGEKDIQLSTNVELKLIQGRSYHVLFWAANAQAPYAVDWDAKTMEVDYDALSANQESYDAFYKYEDLGTVNGAMSKTVELTRPFAQLNIATGDKDEATAAELVVAQTEVTVKNIFSTLNFADGAVSNEVETTFVLADRANGTITANDKEYDQISMNYLLVGGKKLVNVTLGINGELTRSYTSVPVERNYRTNIVGNLLTSAADFTVVILPGFIDDQEGYEPHPNKGSVDELVLAAQLGGEYTLTGDITLTEPLTIPEGVTFVLDLNGKTISAESGNVIKNNGTLILLGDVTTRTSSVASIVSGNTYGVNNSGTLTVNGVKINAIYNSGNLTFNDGIIENTISGRHGIYHCGSELTINAGEFSSTSGNELIHATSANTTTINGGTFTQIGKSYLFGQANAAIDINGGTFNGYVNDNGTNDKMRPGCAVVKGGTFNFDPAAWVAEGYDVLYVAATNSYTVVEGTVVDNATELQSALENATAGSTVVLAENVNYGTIEVDELQDVTIEGNEDAAVRFVTTADSKIENVTIKNVDFAFETGANQTGGAFVVINKDAAIENLVIEGCNIVGDGNKNSYGITGQNPNASIVVKQCNFSNVGYAIQTISAGGYASLVVEECTFDNIISWAIMPQYGSYAGDLTITGCNFKNSNGGLVKSGALTAGHTFTFTNNTITNCKGHDDSDAKWFSFDTTAGTAVVSGNTKDGVDWTPNAANGLK